MATVKWLIRHISRLKAMYFYAILVLGLSAILQLYTVVIQRDIIDDVIVAAQYERLVPYLLGFAACFLGFMFLEVYGPYLFVKNRSRIERNMTFELLAYLYKAIPMGRLHRERTTKFSSLLTIDVMHLSNMVAREVPITLQLCIRLSVLLAIIAMTSTTLLLVLLVICLLYVGLAIWSTPLVKKASRQAVEERNRLHAHLDENISGTRELVSFNRQDVEDRRYFAIFQDYFVKLLREGMLNVNQTQAGEALRWLTIAITILYCGLSVLRGGMTLGTFVMVFQFALQLLVTVQAVYAAYLLFMQQFIQADRLLEVMNEPVSTGDRAFVEPIAQIKMEGVAFAYSPEHPRVLHEVTLEMNAGQKLAFVGESGCGKSTILQLLARFYEPVAGQIRVNGEELPTLLRDDWASRLTLVMQEAYFFNGTIRDNLLMGNTQTTDEQLLTLCKQFCIDGYIASLEEGLDSVIGERGITLSGGERQRLALVRAMVRNAELLILDEATSALDYETERRVQAAIDERRQGMITIIIAHRLSTIRNADQIFVFREGRVLAAGTDEELLETCSFYRELLAKQVA